jgi:secondary thiamine-phosphate synthase enzyme
MVYTGTISLKARGFSDVIDVTADVASVVEGSGIREGIAVVFTQGSTCSVTTIEYEPGAVDDLKRALNHIAPEDATYKHNERWNDGNGFSHVRSALMKPSISIPVMEGRLALGTWQQIVFLDFDNRERERELIVQVQGE